MTYRYYGHYYYSKTNYYLALTNIGLRHINHKDSVTLLLIKI